MERQSRGKERKNLDEKSGETSKSVHERRISDRPVLSTDCNGEEHQLGYWRTRKDK